MITYLTGDATEPKVDGPKIIAHVCNDIGGWGRGFVLSVTKKYPKAEWAYRGWYQGNVDPERIDPPFKLGEVQFVKVADDVYVANMIGQHGIFVQDGVQPIRYDAIESCLKTLSVVAENLKATIHMPRIGCGLAGGKWSEIETIVNRTLPSVYVYDFGTKDARTIPWNR